LGSRDLRTLAGWALAGASLTTLIAAWVLFVVAELHWDAVAIGEFALAGSLVVTGVLVVTYQPWNLFGWSTMVTGTFISLTLLAATIGYYNLRQEPDGAYEVAIWLSCWLWVLAVSIPPINYAVFPDGRLATQRWLWVPIVAVLGGGLTAASIAITAWPFRGPLLLYGPGWLPELTPLPTGARIGLALLVISLIGGVATMLMRLRRSVGVTRDQYKWFALSGVLFVVALIVGLRLGLNFPAAAAIGGLMAPPCVLIAMFRYRLYNIDRVINRTIVYGLVTGLLALAYVAGTIFVGAASRTLTGRVSSETVVAVSTLVVAALFRPVRSRIQQLIDRRFYRRKYDAGLTIERFSSGLRDEVDLDELTVHLMDVIEDTMQPERVTLWLRPVTETG
jgi:hypothetical protein